jgi:glucokinase
MKSFAGIEIVGTRLQIVIGDNRANIHQRYNFTIDGAAGAEAMCKQITSTFDEIDTDIIRGIGIGFGGPVDHKSGKIWTSYEIEGWSNFPIRNWLSDLTGIFVSVENDANVAAYGEALFGAGRNYENVFYVSLGTGVGAGHVLENNIYHGNKPGETEMGHIRLDKSGRTVESTCSVLAIEEKIREANRSFPGSHLAKLTSRLHAGEYKYLSEAVLAGDEMAKEILESTADDLAFSLSHAVHLLHPETVIIGGEAALACEAMRTSVEEKLKHYLMDAFHPGPDIQLSKLKDDAVAIGALALAIQHKD